MSLKETIETDYKNALKAKDKNKISTYRLILSGIKDLDINNRSGKDKILKRKIVFLQFYNTSLLR